MPALLNADDYRHRARRILPRGLFDYIDRGTEDEKALLRLRASRDAITLTPSVLTGHRERSLATRLLDQDLAAPLVIAPTALAGIVSHDGETKLARAASRLGIPVCVSTQSVTTIETIRKGAPDARLWFQLYVWHDRTLTDALLDRHKLTAEQAKAATSPAKEALLEQSAGLKNLAGTRAAEFTAM